MQNSDNEVCSWARGCGGVPMRAVGLGPRPQLRGMQCGTLHVPR